MNEIRYWPSLDSLESTKAIFDFIEVLKKQLKEEYDGLVTCSFEKVTYSAPTFDSVMSVLKEYDGVFGLSESKSEFEKSKTPVKLKKPIVYKFLIMGGNYYFRIFDVEMGELFPVRVKPADGVSQYTGETYTEVRSLDEFEKRVYSFFHSNYVINVINYICSNQKKNQKNG